jgi:hypothetical protein
MPRYWYSTISIASVKLLRHAKHQTVDTELDGTLQLHQQPLGYDLGFATIHLLRQRLERTA